MLSTVPQDHDFANRSSMIASFDGEKNAVDFESFGRDSVRIAVELWKVEHPESADNPQSGVSSTSLSSAGSTEVVGAPTATPRAVVPESTKTSSTVDPFLTISPSPTTARGEGTAPALEAGVTPTTGAEGSAFLSPGTRLRCEWTIKRCDWEANGDSSQPLSRAQCSSTAYAAGDHLLPAGWDFSFYHRRADANLKRVRGPLNA